MLKEFKEFAMRGNVMDMAIGIIIGAAFGQIIASLVADILVPPIGKLLGGVDFKDLFVTLSGGPFASLEEAKKAGATTINYGVFINSVIHFLIVAFAIFMVIKGLNKMKRKQEAPPPSTKSCPECLMEIPIKATRCGHCAVILAK